MKLTHLTDDELDQQLVGLARKEREILTDILNHLRECEARRLYSKYKFQSLFEYAIKRMGYSEDQAARRISAMRLLKELPAIEEKIETGSLTLTHLVKAQSLFNQEKKADRSRTNSEKLDLLNKIESTSKRETEKTLAEESFVASLPQQTKIELDSFDPSLQKKLTRLLGVRASARPNMTLHDLIDEMADLAIEKWDPLAKAERALRKKVDAPRPAPVRVNQRPAPVRRSGSRYIPAVLRHEVYMRDGGICRNCGSNHDVEVDHIVPVARGGTNEISNLRLLCRSCNLRHAIDCFGIGQTKRFIREPFKSYWTTPPRVASSNENEGASTLVRQPHAIEATNDDGSAFDGSEIKFRGTAKFIRMA